MDLGKEMKEIMKEAVIEFVNSLRNDDNTKKIDNVINFLKLGWKFEEMWEELEEITGATEWEMVSLKDIKQEHFSEDEIITIEGKRYRKLRTIQNGNAIINKVEICPNDKWCMIDGVEYEELNV